MAESETAPLRLSIFQMQTPIGVIASFEDDAGFVRALNFQDRVENVRQLLRRYYGEVELRDDRGWSPTMNHVEAYFAGNLTALSEIPITLAGTDFQRSVWFALSRIKVGETASYATIADMIGRPDAARAVGAAIVGNPIALIVPCHRVIGSDFCPTGYAPGLHRNRWLFAHEVAHRDSSPPEDVLPGERNPEIPLPTFEKGSRTSMLRALRNLLHECGFKYVARGRAADCRRHS